MEERIEITITQNGEIVAETFGYKGPVCEEELKSFVEQIGGKKDAKRKPEYYLRVVYRHGGIKAKNR